MTLSQRGISSIATMFANSRSQNRAAFLPYFPVCYPNYDTSLTIMNALAEAGVDGMEIGIPFSDPLADGPTIQQATQLALENGATVATALRAVTALRSRGHELPLLLMSYLNPLLRYGPERFIEHAAESGADGLIIPDLPPEEAAMFADRCRAASLALVFFLAPTSDASRILLVAEQASGFVYVVSLTGTTGAREALPEYLSTFITRLREHCQQPLVLGFGIRDAAQARQLDGLMDGFIVGSEMVNAATEGTERAGQLARKIVNR